MIYLDHALYSPMDDRVEAIVNRPVDWCAPSAPYARLPLPNLSPLYELVGANPGDHFVLTSSGAEAINHVIFGVYVDVTRQSGRHHFLCSQLDEAPAILAMTRLEALGCHFQMVKATLEGIVTAKEFAETLTPRTALLSLSWAGGLTGVVQPLKEIAQLCEERGILLHVDATHVIGKGHYLFRESGAHFITFDGAPLGAPPGTGGLFIREGVELSPLILGGREQASMRAGLIARSLYDGLVEAARLQLERSDLFCMESSLLRQQLEEGLADLSENFFHYLPRVPHITTLGFPGVQSEALCYLLAHQKVYANMGGGQFQHLFHLLKSCGITPALCHSGISFAIGHQTTREQITMAIQQIRQSVTKLRRLSERVLV